MKIIFMIIGLLMSCAQSFAQEALGLKEKEVQEYVDEMGAKAKKAEEQINAVTIKALSKLEAFESKIRNKLTRKKKNKSGNLANVISSPDTDYKKMFALLGNKNTSLKSGVDGEYSPYLDTLRGSLRFLDAGLGDNGGAGILKNTLSASIQKVDGMDNQLVLAERARAFMVSRKEQLKQQLSNAGMLKELKALNKEVFYYSQRIKQYKETLKNSSAIEAEVIKQLYNIPAFSKFIKQNSILAGLFASPDAGSGSSSLNMEGLQSRSVVQNLMDQRGSSSGQGNMAVMQQQLPTTGSAKDAIRNKLNELAGEQPAKEDMNFEPNSQKTKSIFKRFEYGANMQFGKSNSFLPNSSDIALSAGYKLNDKISLGIGAGYKMGLGTGLRDLKISHQGISLRSYLESKIKGSFYISGGYEKNYLAAFQSIQELRNASAWQTSGLIGVSKKISSLKKVKPKAQILFDFLSFYNIPQSPPIIFRFGWDFGK